MRRYAAVALPVLAVFHLMACGGETVDDLDVTADVAPDSVVDTVDTGDTAGELANTDDGSDVAGEDAVTPDLPDNDADPDVSDVSQDVPPFENGAFARRITAESDLMTGPMAAGTIGDILIGNKNVRFIVRDQEIGLYSPSAGSVVDADVVRADGDGGHEKFLELFPMIGFGRVLMAESIEIIDDGRTSGTAVVRVKGFDHGMPIIDMLLPTFPFGLSATMDYMLGPDATELRIDLTVTNNASYEQDVEIGTVVQFGRRLDYFYNQCGSDKTCLTGRRDVEWLAAGSRDVSYGFTGAAGITPKVVLAEEQLLLTATNATTLATGASTSSSQYLIVGNGTIDEIAARAWELRGAEGLRKVTGSIELSETISDIGDVRVFARKQGSTGKLGWVNASSPDAEGNVTLHLPDGVHDITISLPGAQDKVIQVAVAQNDSNTFQAQTNPAGGLQVTINDGNGNLLPAGIIIKNGLDAQPVVGGEFLAVKGGQDSFKLLPGEYTVMAMKGFEYGIASANATITAGETTHLLFSLEREVETPNQVTVVSHAHGENSIDSYVSMPDRVHNALAAGIEFPMVTDHDFFSNLQPFIEAEGMADRIQSTVGIEISPLGFHTVGMNCSNPPPYPTYFAVRFGEYDESGYLATPYTANEIVDRTRGYGCQYVGAAHPWEGSAIFKYIGMGPEDNPADFVDQLDIAKINGLELMNSDDNWEDLESLHLAGWFSLLNHGYKVTAVGGGDQHGYSMSYGHPLNLVEAASDDASTLNPDDVFAAINDGRSILYAGPYIHIDMEGFGPGDVVDISAMETPAIHVTVDAPSWMKIEFINVYANGELVDTRAVTPELGDETNLAVLDIEPEIATDTYYVILAGSFSEESRMPGYGRYPMSVTNPIYLDADGDGWEAPLAQ